MTAEPSGNTIHLNLDFEEQNAETREPFRFTLGGREYVITDPVEVAWQDMLEIESPEDFARYCMSTEDRQAFLKEKLTTRGFNLLFQKFSEHFDIDLKRAGKR